MSAAPQLELCFESAGRHVGRSAEILSLDGPSCHPADLATRLRACGLPVSLPIETHANLRVLVSFTARGALRVHRGYAMAPDAVLAAIACWSRSTTRRAERRRVARLFVDFPVHEHVPPVRAARRLPEPARPGDERILARLGALHRELNFEHFAGELGPIGLQLSARMRRRLGEFRLADPPGGLAEIRVSRRHLRRDGWEAVRETLAHEMVHQWQAETGRKLTHGREFRACCRRIGISARATRCP